MLAREAFKAVKQALAAKGLKPQYIAMREIVTMAKDYIAAHPGLIDEAKQIVKEWRAWLFPASVLPSKILPARRAETTTKSAIEFVPKRASDNN